MTITIASPVDGASFQIGTNIQFSVNLENASSNGVHVTYYEGAKVRARATAPPFDATWHAPGLGLHAITAVVTDKAGDQATSQSIMISVGPRNDQFDHAIPVKGKAPTFSGTTLGASLEPGEPNWNGGGSVWYSWTPTSSGRLGMSISKGGDEPLIGLYTGDSVSNLTTVGSSWLPYGWINAFDCAVQAGTNYKILVSGTASDPTHFVVKSAFVPLPSNDDFENRAVLPPYGGKMTSQNFSATWQPGEPDDLVPYTAGYGSSHRTIWWTWTAPVKGRISFNIDCNFGASTMGIYSGDALLATAIPA